MAQTEQEKRWEDYENATPAQQKELRKAWREFGYTDVPPEPTDEELAAYTAQRKEAARAKIKGIFGKVGLDMPKPTDTD
jgi:hypothetical protein